MADTIDLQTWRHNAAIGDEIKYHRGFVANDRLRDSNTDKVAADALRLAEKGRICLVQKKIRDGLYEYLAVAADLKPWLDRT